MRSSSCRAAGLSVVALLVLAVLAVGCQTPLTSGYSADPVAHSANYETAAAGTAVVRGNNAPPEALPVAAEGTDPAGAVGQMPSGGAVAPQRQIVYSARFDVAAANVEEAMNRMTVAVENGGGYLEMREDTHVVCRIPAARFQEFVAMVPTFGTVVSQTIRSEDVTRQYHDLTLHIETADWSRRRVLELMERAEKIEDILKLEAELLRLTTTIESLKGTLKDLSEQIAYSRVEVNFRPNAPQSKLDQPGAPSPFAWVNRIGAEQVIGGFGSIDAEEKLNLPAASALLPGGISIGALEGFIVVQEDRTELKAVTPDSSKLWIREFAVPHRGNLQFWSKAVKADFVEHRGYELVDEQSVRDDKDREGVQMVFEVAVGGKTQRYLVALFVSDAPFWQSGNTVRTVEFTAPQAKFDKYVTDVRRACGWNAGQ